jgi:hypothetical protein
MTTFQNIADSARIDLQDAAKTRYTDSQLLSYAIDGVQEMFRYRPDFQVGKYTDAAATYTLSSAIPVPSQYVMLLTHYVVFRAEMRDDEYAQDGRALAFLGRFEKELKK